MSQVVLGLDTATHVNVGIARIDNDGAATVLAERYVSGNKHVEQLMPLIVEALAEAQLGLADVTLIAVGLGPGPFTGLRVGIATARTLAATLRIPLKGVCTLDAVAAQHDGTEQEFLAATDARRKELYWAQYRRCEITKVGSFAAATGHLVRVEGPSVTAPVDIPALPVVGPAADLYPEAMGTRPRHTTILTPGAVARYAVGLPDLGVEPLYLRRPDATEPSRRKSALVAKLQEAAQ